jgi:hypothetical protein
VGAAQTINPDDIELTEAQKFSLAIMAGANIETSKYENGRLTMTTEPCGVVKVGNQWQVYTKARK